MGEQLTNMSFHAGKFTGELKDLINKKQPSREEFTTYLIQLFEEAVTTANRKEYIAELDDKEVCAICFFAAIPFESDHETGLLKFNPFHLRKRDNKWTAYLLPHRR